MLRAAALLLVLIVVLIGAGRWLAVHRQAERAAGAMTTPQNSDYYLRQATLYQLAKDGSLAYRAHTRQALHFPDDSAHLDDVDVHYVNGTATAWDVHANQGRIPAGSHEIYLYDGVTGQHPFENGRVAHFSTDHAWVRPDDNRIDSDARVKATQPGQTLTGDGMQVNLKTHTLNLLHNVHATYDP